MSKVEYDQESGARVTHPLFSWVELAHMDYAMLTGVPGHCAPDQMGSSEEAHRARRCCDDVPTTGSSAPSTISRAVGHLLAFACDLGGAIRGNLTRGRTGLARKRSSATEPLPEIAGPILASPRRI